MILKSFNVKFVKLFLSTLGVSTLLLSSVSAQNNKPPAIDPADDKYMVFETTNGKSEVKDKNGKTVVILHENYKHVSACAYHCLAMKTNIKK